MGKLEPQFQKELKEEIEKRFPGCKVFKMDPTNNQGVPDLLILFKKKWALLECKKSENAKHRPNQDYWVDFYNKMSFARFIFPENKEQVLHEMEQSFKSRRKTRLPRSK